MPLLLCGNRKCTRSKTCVRFNVDPTKLGESQISVSPNLCVTDQFEMYAETESSITTPRKFGTGVKIA